MTSAPPLAFHFRDDGVVPNNPALPALVYKHAFDLSNVGDPEGEVERRLAENGWGRDQWRNGIYPFTHYHSMIHEALGIARGTASVQLGGEQGEIIEFAPGDVAVLPAGTGHRRLSASRNLVVIGAYPAEGTYNLCRAEHPADRIEALRTIPEVPLPRSDPITGPSGPLLDLWPRE
jgi:uncharacterized protein YjlB